MDPRTAEDKAHWNERWPREARRKGPSEFLARIDHLLPHVGKALDIACGTGENDAYLARHFTVKAIDFSDVALAFAKEALEKSGMADRVVLVNADVLEVLPREPSGAYDVVTCLNFFNVAIVADMKRVLKPGGSIAVQAYTIDDERITASRFKDNAITTETLLEPRNFGSFWILIHDIENYIDKEGLKRQRVNFFARKPFAS